MRTEIKENGIKYAIVFSEEPIPEGLTFYTQDSDYLQVASWNYNKGRHLKAHAHKLCPRTSDITQEFVFIKKGSIRVYMYNRDGKLIKNFDLHGNDFMIIFEGGHAYDILEDNTEVMEVKNGPYPGLEKDKKTLE
ncbi:MAG: hypothetical protein JW983_04120 [Elusimicrobia bacterium]|nr:hypothetical protein [Elusimicrobiota bacterium]